MTSLVVLRRHGNRLMAEGTGNLKALLDLDGAVVHTTEERDGGAELWHGAGLNQSYATLDKLLATLE